MALKNMSLLNDATLAASGGNACVFADDGITIPNGLHLIVPSDSNYSTRRQATFKYRAPVLDKKTNMYGKDKKSVSYVVPLTLSDGSTVFNVIRIEREVSPYYDATDTTLLNNIAAQLLFDTDTTNFWANGSLS